MTPPSNEPADAAALAVGAELALALLAFAVLGFVMVWAVLRVSRQEPQAMVTVIVGLLTFTAILSYAATREEVLGTLAATGLGALAGAVSQLFDRHDDGD